MKRCSKCILPETYADIKFDENDVCDVCRQVDELKKVDWIAKEREFRSILEKYKDLAKRQDNPYDCIVPFSGGKDSTYTLYTLTQQYGMKPLAVTFNHLFFTDVVKENTTKVLNKLGVDHVMFAPDWQVAKKLCLKSFKLTGDFCWHCHCGIYAYPMQIAVKYKIPLLVWGTTDYSNTGGLRDWKFFRRYVNLGLNPEDLVGDGITLRNLQPYTYPSEKELKDLNIIGINQGDYIRWNVREQVELIKREFGWKGSNVEGSFVDYDKIECKYVGIRDYIKFIRRGYGRSAQLASVDIRAGLMTREKALEVIKEYDGKRPSSLDAFLEDIGISEKEYLEIAKTHEVQTSNKTKD
jgi:N-acetyl sugar amidotransferase